jgi:zinc transport system substrate-binding protein
MKRFFFPLLLVLAVTSRADEAEKLRVYVPVLPYEYLLQRLGGDWIEAKAIVDEGGDPHNYSPSPRQVADIARSNLLFSGGLTFEANFYIAVGDGGHGPKEVNLLEGLELLEGSCAECAEAADGGKEHAHEHEHEEKDAHVWLSPRVLRHQATRAAAVLKENLPAKAAPGIDANLAALNAELDAVDAELKTLLAPKKGRSFFVFHGAFAYFALDYGLVQEAIEIGNRRPTPKQLAGIAKQAEEEGVTTIFVQPQFDQSSAEALAESIGGKVQPLDPLEKDVIANLRAIGKAIAAAP